MRVIDTSAWIELFIDSPTARDLSKQFPAPRQRIIPTIVQLELAFWAARELSKSDVRNVIAGTLNCSVVHLNTHIAVRAAEIRHARRLPTADAIIYATAMALDADLLTCDAHFKDLPHVLYVPKTAT